MWSHSSRAGAEKKREKNSRNEGRKELRQKGRRC